MLFGTYSTDSIERICRALAHGNQEEAGGIARREIPFQPFPRPKRSYSGVDALRIFLRDGFIDRYSGQQLVFPGVLRLLSLLLPDEVPYHPNWKTTESHLLYWHLSPTLDHLVPVARGGAEQPDNWVCTSMLRNAAKGLWTLEELGWTLHPPGDITEWDGMLQWYLNYVQSHERVLSNAFLKKWYRLALRVREPSKTG